MSKFTPTSQQLNCIELAKQGNLKIEAAAGASKSQPVFCKVQTPSGEKEIGELVLNDPIFRKDGSIGKVVGIFPQGVKPTYKVTFRDNTYTLCNDEHLWSVKRKGYPLNGYKTVQLKEIIRDGIFTKDGNMRYSIPLCKPVQYTEKQYYIHPYILGLLIGDGSLSGNVPRCSFGEKDIEIVQLASKLLPEKFKFHLRKTGENCTQGTIVEEGKQYGKPNKMKVELDRLNLLVRSGEKHIPEEYLQGSVEQRLELLRGLMDSDGCCSANRTSFSSTSYQLIKDMKVLIQSLGGVVIEQKTGKNENRNPLYCLNVKVFENPFRVKSKAKLWKFSKKNPPSRYIKSIEKVGEDEHVCIKVDAEDSLYLTDEFIVTHNTTTISMIADELVTPSLYLVFNKKLADDARGKFPPHVEIRTTHSLAYQHYGAALREKLSRPRGEYINVAGTGNEIANYFKIKDFVGEFTTVSRAAIGLAVKYTLAKYEQSSQQEITEDIIPFEDTCNKSESLKESEKKRIKANILSVAQKMWEKRIDPDSPVLANHNTYLKLYQLSKPDLSEYEIIYLDESQDLNPCTLDIVLQQSKCKVISVGDTAQAIYGWNGSVNALASLEYAEGKLSKSFRFGQTIADVANKVLGKEWVEGFEKVESKVFDLTSTLPKTGYAYLFRTNSALVFEAMNQIKKGLKVNIEMDSRDFAEFMWSIVALRKGDDRSKIKHPDVIPFANWNDFLAESEHSVEFKRALYILQNNNWYAMLQEITKHKNVDDPDVILTTAHKSKGREFDVVVLADDFPEIYDKNGIHTPLSEEESNLLYVALTRAKNSLFINKTVQQILDFGKDNSEYDESEVNNLFTKGLPVGNIN